MGINAGGNISDLQAETNLSSANTEIVVQNLNLDLDKMYYIVLNCSPALACTPYYFLNDYDVDAKYYTQYLESAGATITASGTANNGVFCSIGSNIQGDGFLYKGNDGYTRLSLRLSGGTLTSPKTWVLISTFIESDNIIKFTFSGDGVEFETGSYIKFYRMNN